LIKKILYVVFYVLFSKDIWRILLGCLFAYLLAPQLFKPEITKAGQILIWIMLACIGWSITGYPSKLITNFLKKIFLRSSSYEK
jgi:hypothetical protein